MPSKLKCNSLLFADDLKIYQTITEPNDCINLQRDIDALYTWCTENELLLNINKCKYLSFSNRIVQLLNTYHINGAPLTKVNTINDLGIILDSKLKFDMHIDFAVKKAYKMLGFIMRATSKFTNRACTNMLYNTLVRSHLEYNSYIWSPFHENQIHTIERVQKNYTRQIAYKFYIRYEDYNDRLRKMGMFSLKQRRVLSDMCQLYKIVHSPGTHLFSQLNIRNNPYSNRHNNLFTLPTAKSDYGLFRSILNRYQRIFAHNFNHIGIENVSLGQFRSQMIQALREQT